LLRLPAQPAVHRRRAGPSCAIPIRRHVVAATYSHVVGKVNGPHRTVYLAGQTGADALARSPGFRAQAVR